VAASAILDNQMVSLGGLDMSYTVSSCDKCGFLYASKLPPADCYEHYYRTLSKYDLITSINHISPLDTIRAKATIRLCATHLRPDSVIVDLGCSIGYLLHEFQKAGWSQLYGLDPAPSASESAKALFGLTSVRHGGLADATTLMPLERADLVCLTGVLEHLWSPKQDLSRIFAQLRVGTLVLVEVPAVERFARDHCEPFGEFSLEHIQYFTKRGLMRMFASLGADTVNISFLNLADLATDSLFGLFRVASYGEAWRVPFEDHVGSTADVEMLVAYIEQSSKAFKCVIERIKAAPRPWIIYGAGSHTARLLPVLSREGMDSSILGVVDVNTNLMGQKMNQWTIVHPFKLIDEHPEASIIISSFRAQNSIYSELSGLYPNLLVKPYPSQDIQ